MRLIPAEKNPALPAITSARGRVEWNALERADQLVEEREVDGVGRRAVDLQERETAVERRELHRRHTRSLWAWMRRTLPGVLVRTCHQRQMSALVGLSNLAGCRRRAQTGYRPIASVAHGATTERLLLRALAGPKEQPDGGSRRRALRPVIRETRSE